MIGLPLEIAAGGALYDMLCRQHLSFFLPRINGIWAEARCGSVGQHKHGPSRTMVGVLSPQGSPESSLACSPDLGPDLDLKISCNL